jgi:dTDP-4-dehydrorhamnose 3,5-epimerase
MKMVRLPISGTFQLEPECAADQRGFFTRGWCRQVLEEQGLEPVVARTEVLVHEWAGAVRQPRCLGSPWEEALFARCTRGRIHVVLVDLRGDEPGALIPIELAADARHGLYLPAGIAFGYQTLEDKTEVFLQHGEIMTEDATDRCLETDEIVWPLAIVF